MYCRIKAVCQADSPGPAKAGDASARRCRLRSKRLRRKTAKLFIAVRNPGNTGIAAGVRFTIPVRGCRPKRKSGPATPWGCRRALAGRLWSRRSCRTTAAAPRAASRMLPGTLLRAARAAMMNVGIVIRASVIAPTKAAERDSPNHPINTARASNPNKHNRRHGGRVFEFCIEEIADAAARRRLLQMNRGADSDCKGDQEASQQSPERTGQRAFQSGDFGESAIRVCEPSDIQRRRNQSVLLQHTKPMDLRICQPTVCLWRIRVDKPLVQFIEWISHRDLQCDRIADQKPISGNAFTEIKLGAVAQNWQAFPAFAPRLRIRKAPLKRASQSGATISPWQVAAINNLGIDINIERDTGRCERPAARHQ